MRITKSQFRKEPHKGVKKLLEPIPSIRQYLSTNKQTSSFFAPALYFMQSGC